VAQHKDAPDLTDRLTRPLDVAARNVRAATAVAPARPAYAGGFRAALATVVPLIVAHVFRLSGGTWMSLAGFSGALVDKGGSYSSRAIAIGLLTIFGAIAVFIGAVASHALAAAVVLTFLVAVVCSLGRAWGNTGGTIGGSVLNMFVISLAYPATGLADSFGRAGYAIIGGAWSALLALVLWPVRPYRPARLAIASGFSALADYVDEVVSAIEAPPDGEDRLPAGSLVVRAALEHASATLATIRRGRPGESSRGERLLVLRETTDRMFGTLIAVAETVAVIPASARKPERQAIILAALRDVASALRDLATRVEHERQTGTTSVAFSGAPLRESLAPIDDRTRAADMLVTGELAWTDAQYAHVAVLLDRVAQFAGVAAANVADLDGAHVPMPAIAPEAEEATEPRALLAPLASVMTPDSLVLRHALRVGTVTAVAVLLAGILELPRGYWVTITVVIILQPYTGVTTLRAVQRGMGTVVGGVLTAALGALFHDQIAILVMAFVFAAVSVALLPINYTAFSVFLTPTFVLLAEASAGDWHLAGVRVLDTLLGGVLALLGAWLLWPAPERKRVPAYMAALVRANRDYLRTVVSAFADRSDEAGRSMRGRRRDAALAAINAEESFQRLMGEHGGSSDELSPAMTLLAYSRRFTVSIAALAVSRHAVDPMTATVLEQFSDGAAARLDAVATRLESSATAADTAAAVAATTSALDRRALDPVVRARLRRLTRQLDTIESAAAGVTEPGGAVAR
jgi:uncharacterized membrane protein YccC